MAFQLKKNAPQLIASWGAGEEKGNFKLQINGGAKLISCTGDRYVLVLRK